MVHNRLISVQKANIYKSITIHLHRREQILANNLHLMSQVYGQKVFLLGMSACWNRSLEYRLGYFCERVCGLFYRNCHFQTIPFLSIKKIVRVGKTGREKVKLSVEAKTICKNGFAEGLHVLFFFMFFVFFLARAWG